MPLIVLTGYPSSGKSTLSVEIKNFLLAKLQQEGDTRKVTVVSDSDNLDWEGRDSTYSSIAKEKELRAWLRSEIQRHLSLNHIVLLDCAAYIKGFRYEIYCIAKEAKTQYCVVEVLLDQDICWKRNEKVIANRLDSRNQVVTNDGACEDPLAGYSRQTFDALIFRYEKCDERNRWDSPLFRLYKPDDKLNLDDLYKLITKQEPLAPNKCTSLASSTTTIYKPKSET